VSINSTNNNSGKKNNVLTPRCEDRKEKYVKYLISRCRGKSESRRDTYQNLIKDRDINSTSVNNRINSQDLIKIKLKDKKDNDYDDLESNNLSNHMKVGRSNENVIYKEDKNR